uniref:Serpin domain-containing protein n=1 Tax=Panagrolaimus davidi TaxID=227884 RepID=A0A914PGB1_9BILA
MIHAGAKGKSAEQVASVIGKGKNGVEIMEYYSEFVKRHASAAKDETSSIIPENRKRSHTTEAQNVNIANGFFVADNIPLVPTYKKLIKDKFLGNIQSINFSKSVEAVKEINTFVADSTNNAIKGIFTSDDISSETSLILINAIHFIGFWEEPFEDRKRKTFNSNPPRKIPMMSKSIKPEEEEWNFQRGEDWKCLGIPYKNRKAWLYIVLPTETDGLSSLIKKIDYSFIEKCTESEVDLEKNLKAFGIEEIFSDTANLSGMLEGPHKIEKAIHKAVIKIDEKGTEASAATGIQMNARSVPQPFFATHPFLFFITSVDGPDSTKPTDILFMGTFC